MSRKIGGLLLVLVFNFSALKGQEIPIWKIADLEAYIQNSKKPTVVNFWATFCKPCIAEIPHFQKLTKQYAKDSVQLLLVSLDMEEMYPKIKTFGDKFGFTAPIVLLAETNADIFCPKIDKKWSGAIPASLFLNNSTGYRKFFEAEMSEQKFETELRNMTAVATHKKIGFLLPAILLSLFIISLIVLWYSRRNGKW